MSATRKARRRRERQQARNRAGSRVRNFNPAVRLALVLAGLVAIVAGFLLLTGATSHTASRLGRVGGIIMLLGVVAILAGVVGKI